MKKIQISLNHKHEAYTAFSPESTLKPEHMVKGIDENAAIDFSKLTREYIAKGVEILTNAASTELMSLPKHITPQSHAQWINGEFLDIAETLEQYTTQVAYYAGMTVEEPIKPKTPGAESFVRLEATLKFLEKMGFDTETLLLVDAIGIQRDMVQVIEKYKLPKI